MTACANLAVPVWFRRFCFVAALFVGAGIQAANAAANATITWTDLAKGGYVILLRHTTTVPGVGDPPGFRVDDCSTQRNLSDQGRTEARRWGAMVRKHRIPIAHVYTSQWCRCVDTAKLAFAGALKGAAPEPWPALNSFFDNPANEPQQTADVKSRLAKMKVRGKNIVLVTHQVNISALSSEARSEASGEAPAMGEAIVMRMNSDGSLSRAGRLRAN
jgi:phosphohistidine phosphatase SixA